jgi:hypothetical protein
MAIAAAALALPGGAAAGVHAKLGAYTGQAEDGKLLSVEVVKRGGTRRLRLLEFKDGCASTFVLPPLGLGKAQRTFHDDFSGNTNSVGYRTVFDGRIESAKKMTITTQSSVGDLFPPPGTPPGTANHCSVTTNFALRFLPDGL